MHMFLVVFFHYRTVSAVEKQKPKQFNILRFFFKSQIQTKAQRLDTPIDKEGTDFKID